MQVPPMSEHQDQVSGLLPTPTPAPANARRGRQRTTASGTDRPLPCTGRPQPSTALPAPAWPGLSCSGHFRSWPIDQRALFLFLSNKMKKLFLKKSSSIYEKSNLQSEIWINLLF